MPPRVKKPELDDLTQTMVQSIDWVIKSNQQKLDKFKTSFAADPAYAFEWAPVEEAVTVRVLTHLRKVAVYKGWKRAVEVAHDNALSGARWGSRSTSVMSNYVEQAKTAAYAKFYDDFVDLESK